MKKKASKIAQVKVSNLYSFSMVHFAFATFLDPCSLVASGSFCIYRTVSANLLNCADTATSMFDGSACQAPNKTVLFIFF